MQLFLQQHDQIKHLGLDQSYIYRRDNNARKYTDKFHSSYILNCINLLFTGSAARVKSVMTGTYDRLDVPLLAVVCTLVGVNFEFGIALTID